MNAQNSVWNRCTLVNLDQPGNQVEAYFNPKEIGIEKKVPWNAHGTSKADVPALEFTNAGPKTLTFELFFDCYEDKLDVHRAHVADLEALTMITPGSQGKDKHPPRVKVVWGDKSFLDFAGVITSLAVKYTMFLPDGTPVRASCTITLQEIRKVECQVQWQPRGRQSSGKYISETVGRGYPMNSRDDLLE